MRLFKHPLTWVYATAAYGFMNTYLRYVNPRLNHAEHDRYYGESVRACRYYGANCTPASVLLCNWIVDSEGEDTTSGLRFTYNRQLHLPQRFAKLWSGPEANHPVTSNHLVRFRSTSPRKNLPPSISRKRAEANFLRSFERAFVAGHCRTKQITWQDFALQGYGIPDLITFAWSTHQNQATMLSLEALRQKLRRQRLTAFELKLCDWRKGIVQAYRYRYFCDRSIVVLPRDVVDKACKRLELFQSLEVGLWSFDPDTEAITKYFTPHEGTARNPEARNKAIESILNKIQLCKAVK